MKVLFPPLAKPDDRLWPYAYGATLLIPLMLIFMRGLADVLCVAVCLLFLLRCWRKGSWEWMHDPFMRLCFIIWLWMLLVVSPFAASPEKSFAVALPWIRYVVFFAALTRWVLVERRAIYSLASLWTLLLGLVAIDTLWQYVTGLSLTGQPILYEGRLSGPMDSVRIGIFLAKLAVPVLGLYLFFALADGARLRLALALAWIFAMLAIILLSGERTAFFSALLTVAAVLALMGLAEPRWRASCLGILALLFGLVLLLIMTQPWVQERIDLLIFHLSDFRKSNYGQLFIGGTALGLDHWLTGAGFKGFRILCPGLIDSGAVHYCNLHPHNAYIEWFAETGLPGLLLFVALVGLLLKTALEAFFALSGAARLLPAVALGALIVHFFPVMVTQSQFSSWPGILMWYSLGLSFAGLNLASADRKSSFSPA